MLKAMGRSKTCRQKCVGPLSTSDFQPSSSSLPLTECIALACMLEAAIPKPGNVHRSADFAELTFIDFAVSSIAIAPWLSGEHEGPGTDAALGDRVLGAVREMRTRTSTNTHLGTILLIAPLAIVARTSSLREGLAEVLGQLTPHDAAPVYQAIRLASPGGLGETAQMDVRDAAPKDLVAAMKLAADRDLVARQYTKGFREVFDQSASWISQGLQQGWSLTNAVIHAHLRLMATHPDSLIARKCGKNLAAESAARAASVLDAGPPNDENYLRQLSGLDFWLRSDGNRRNPGTTADLIAAGLFVLLRDDRVRWPLG